MEKDSPTSPISAVQNTAALPIVEEEIVPSSLEQSTPVMYTVKEEAPETIRGGRRRIRTVLVRSAVLSAVVIAFGLIGVLAVRSSSAQNNVQNGNFAVSSLPSKSLAEISVGTTQKTPPKLVVNGQLNVNNSLVLAPTVQPVTGTAGQLYFDKSSNLLTFYNGKAFVNVSGETNITNVTNVNNVNNVNDVTNVTNVTNITNINGAGGGSPIFDPTTVVSLQAGTPGTAQTGNLNISGTAIVNLLQTNVIDSSGGTLAINNDVAITGRVSGQDAVNSNEFTTLSQVQGLLSGGPGSGVILQATTPGTAQTGNLNISGTGIFGTALQSASLLSPSLDLGSSGTLAIGTANATIINIATNNIGHTINIGTGAATQAISLGSLSSNSSLALLAGAGNIIANVQAGGVAYKYNLQIGGTTVLGIDQVGRTTFRPMTDDNGVFVVQNSSGSPIFWVDSTSNTVGTCNGCSLQAGSGGIYTSGALSFTSNTTMANYTTPLGTVLQTKISIPNQNPGAFGQLLAFGLPASADTNARGLTLLDARAAAHQPTLTILSPNESQGFGLSWDGSNITPLIKTSTGRIGFATSDGTGLVVATTATTATLGVGSGSAMNGQVQFFNATNGNHTILQAPSVSISYISNLPSAIGAAGQCLAVSSVASGTQSLGYSDCLTGASASGSFVQLQGATPGTAQTGNLNISGTGIFDGVNANTVQGGSLYVSSHFDAGNGGIYFLNSAGNGYVKGLYYDHNANTFHLGNGSNVTATVGEFIINTTTGANAFVVNAGLGTQFKVEDYTSANAAASVSSSSITQPTLATVGIAGQIADLFQLQNSSETVLSGFTSAGKLYYANASFAATLDTSTLTANRTISLPDETGIICIQNSTNCGFLTGAAASGNYVGLQATTPGTAQTGNLNISGTGIFGTALQAASLLSPSLDRANAGTLAIGDTNATTINIATNSAAHTVNIATGAAAQTVTIGSNTGASAVTIQSGTGGLALNGPANGTIGANLGIYNVLNIDSSGRTTLQSKGNDSAAFKVQNAASQEVFAVDTLGNIVRTCATCALQAGNGGIALSGALTFAATGYTNYVTPLGTSISTKINIPNTDPGAYNQLIALGLPSGSASTARAITLLDARTTTHQPTLAVLSPNESQIAGFSWDGSDIIFNLKTTTTTVDISNDQGTAVRIRSSGSTQQILEVGRSNSTSGALQLNNSTNTNSASLQAPSVSTSYITNLPTAIGTAGQCLSVASVAGSTQSLGYANCASAGTSVALQATTPGTPQTGHLNISGTGIFGDLQAGTFVASNTATIAPQFSTTINGTTTGRIYSDGNAVFVGIAASGDVIASSGNPSSQVFQAQLNGTTNAYLQADGQIGATTVTASNTVITPLLDRATAGTLSVGVGNATTIAIGGLNTSNLNFGTSANNKTVTIGSSGTVNNTTAINIGNTISSGGANTIQIGGTGVTGGSNTGTTITTQAGQTKLSLANAGAVLQTFTNSVTAFQIQNSGGTSFMTADSSNQIINTKDINIGSGANLGGAGRLFSDGFESGNFGLWNYLSGSVTADTTQARNGKFAAKIVQAGTNSTVGQYITNSVTVAIRGSFYTAANPGASNTMLMSTYNSADASGFVGVSRSSTGLLCVYRSFVGSSNCSATALPLNSWNKVELVLTTSTAATGSYTLYLNGASILTASSVRTNTSQTGMNLVELGDSSATQTIWVDDYSADTQLTGDSSSLYVADSLHVSGTSSFGNSVLIRSASNSTTAFQIQNAVSTALFTADTQTGTITLGTGANTVVFTAAGGLIASGTAQHTRSIDLSAEYAGAVLNASGDSACSAANGGTMTSGYDTTFYRNYYNWTSNNAANQCYDVVVDVKLPSDFSAWAASDPINVQALTDNASNSAYAIAIRNVTGAAWDGNYGSSYAAPGTLTTSWSDVATSGFSGSYAAGDRISIKLRMQAKSNANLQLSNITLNYQSKY